MAGPKITDLGLGLSIGTSLGIALGIAMNNLAVGIALGVALGFGIGNGLEYAKGRKLSKNEAGKAEASKRSKMTLFVISGLLILAVLLYMITKFGPTLF
jgi:hypothetical protein